MQEKIKVSSLSESQKKEFMKQGKKLHFRLKDIKFCISIQIY